MTLLTSLGVSLFGSSLGLVLIASVVVLLCFLYKYAYAPYQYLKGVGIPGPTPMPLIGNLHQSKSLLVDMRTQLCAQYGKTCGFYAGTLPFVVTTDPELLKQILIKKFDCFENRASNSGGVLKFKIDGKDVPALVLMHGDEWRTVRHSLTPAFSSLKMKLMEPMIRDSSELVLKKFESIANTGKSLNMTKLFQKMALEVTLAVAFGREVRIQEGESDELYQQARKVVEAVTRPPGTLGQLGVLIALGALFPSSLSWLFSQIEPMTQFGKGKDYLVRTAVKLRDAKRRENGKSKSDLLQVMLDAVDANKMDDAHTIMMSVVALIAGHEPVTNSIIFTSYLLATNNQVQEKLVEEIAQYFSDNPDKSYYEAAQEIEYLDQVFQESMRIYSPAPTLIRRCNKSCEIGGYQIEKGTYIVAPVYGVHYNEEYWPEPEKFDPERFSKQNKAKQHSCAYLPFGMGPRQCIGMRMAILEVKAILLDILRKYKFVVSPETKVPLELNLGVTSSPKEDVYLSVESLGA